jgi:hypothetical protein
MSSLGFLEKEVTRLRFVSDMGVQDDLIYIAPPTAEGRSLSLVVNSNVPRRGLCTGN